MLCAGSHSTVLSLTSCASYQFTCNDGLCISLENRSEHQQPGWSHPSRSSSGVTARLTARTSRTRLTAG